MTYGEFIKLDEKLDKIIDKIESICERVVTIETKQNIYTKILTWGGTTMVGFMLAVILKVYF